MSGLSIFESKWEIDGFLVSSANIGRIPWGYTHLCVIFFSSSICVTRSSQFHLWLGRQKIVGKRINACWAAVLSTLYLLSSEVSATLAGPSVRFSAVHQRKHAVAEPSPHDTMPAEPKPLNADGVNRESHSA